MGWKKRPRPLLTAAKWTGITLATIAAVTLTAVVTVVNPYVGLLLSASMVAFVAAVLS